LVDIHVTESVKLKWELNHSVKGTGFAWEMGEVEKLQFE